MSKYDSVSEKGKRYCKESVSLICFGTVVFIILMIVAISTILGLGKSIAFVVLCAIGIVLSIVYCVLSIIKLRKKKEDPKAYFIIGLLSFFSAMVPFIFMMIFAASLNMEKDDTQEKSSSTDSSFNYGYIPSGYWNGYSDNWYVKEGDTSGQKYRLDGIVMRKAENYDDHGGCNTYGNDIVYVEGEKFIKIKDPNEERCEKIYDNLTKENEQYKNAHSGESSMSDNPAYRRMVAKYMHEIETGKASFVNPFWTKGSDEDKN